jgi:hypothetical protein
MKVSPRNEDIYSIQHGAALTSISSQEIWNVSEVTMKANLSIEN